MSEKVVENYLRMVDCCNQSRDGHLNGNVFLTHWQGSSVITYKIFIEIIDLSVFCKTLLMLFTLNAIENPSNHAKKKVL